MSNVNYMMKEEKVKEGLQLLKSRLRNCGYPKKVIEKAFHCAQLQGPAPNPQDKKLIPFVTTNHGNMDFSQMTKKLSNLIQNCKSDKLEEVFKSSKIILSTKQPPNIRKILMPSQFRSQEQPEVPGAFKCHRSNCNICKIYLQEVREFICSNGKTWEIRCHITCKSKNVLYFLVCNMCNKETYTGKTNNLRKRTNVHISSCRTGNTDNIFDIHVYNCGIKNKCHIEPFFKLYTFMSVSREEGLIHYEKKLHREKYDTMNR